MLLFSSLLFCGFRIRIWQSLLVKQHPTINHCNQMYHLSIFSAWHRNFYYYHVICFIVMVDWNIALVYQWWQKQQNHNPFVLFCWCQSFITMSHSRDESEFIAKNEWRLGSDANPCYSLWRNWMIVSEVRQNLINLLLCWIGWRAAQQDGMHTQKFEFLWHKISMNYYQTAHVPTHNDTLSFPSLFSIIVYRRRQAKNMIVRLLIQMCGSIWILLSLLSICWRNRKSTAFCDKLRGRK